MYRKDEQGRTREPEAKQKISVHRGYFFGLMIKLGDFIKDQSARLK
jgi:hypothetical protein